MPKAIKITTENKHNLELTYNLEEGALTGAEGYFLTADFGQSVAILGLLSEQRLKETYIIPGKPLKNDYFEVTEKPLPPSVIGE